MAAAVYVTWESGHVAVMHLHTREILAYSKAPFDSMHTKNSAEIMHLPLCVVLDEQRKPITLSQDQLDSTIFAAASSSSAVEAQRSHTSPLLPGGIPKIDMKKVGGTILGHIASLDQQHQKASEHTSAVPPGGPKYLLQIRCNSIVYFDLSKFALPLGNGKFSALHPGSATIRALSDNDITAANVVGYLEEAARAWADPEPCLTYLDAAGVCSIISLRDQCTWCSNDVLGGTLGSQALMSRGLVLPNGNIYSLQNGSIIYSCYPRCNLYVQPKPLPIRACPQLMAQQVKASQFRTGRETVPVAKGKGFSTHIRKMTGVSRNVDLDKLFLKTKDQKDRDELLLGADDSDSNAVDNTQALRKDATRKAVATANASAMETRDAFDERGEALSRLNQKTDNFKNAALDYRETAKATKENLKQKASRWGLF